MQVRDDRLYLGGVAAEGLARRLGTPLYVYDGGTIQARYATLAQGTECRIIRAREPEGGLAG